MTLYACKITCIVHQRAREHMKNGERKTAGENAIKIKFNLRMIVESKVRQSGHNIYARMGLGNRNH